MKKNVMFMLWLASIVLLAGCWQQKVENFGSENTGDDVKTQESSIDAQESDATLTGEVDEEGLAQDHSDWVATSLAVEDLNRIEETLPPIRYTYETYDMTAQSIVNSGSYKLADGEEPVFMIPEYATMANREVISSGIEDDMIYTLTKITLQDGTELNVLYVNEPDTLFCRAISVENGNQTTLYTNFVYDADLE